MKNTVQNILSITLAACAPIAGMFIYRHFDATVGEGFAIATSVCIVIGGCLADLIIRNNK